MMKLAHRAMVFCVAILAACSTAWAWELLHVAYYPSYDVMKVEITPRGIVVLDASKLRTPDGEPGLLGEYFDYSQQKEALLQREELQGDPVFVREDSEVDFNWRSGSPTAEVPTDWFGIRWTGKLMPLPQPVRLMTVSDDGVRLWVDGEKVIDDWTGHAPKPNYAGMLLESGRQYDLRLEYFEHVAGAMCMFGYQLAEETAKGISSAEIVLLSPDGDELLREQMQWEGESGVMQFDVPDLPEGIYTVAAKLPGVSEPVTRRIVRKQFEWEGNTLRAVVAWRRGPTGVGGAGHATEGPPGTWETPSSPWSSSCGAGWKLNAVDPREVTRPPSREQGRGAPRYRWARKRVHRDG